MIATGGRAPARVLIIDDDRDTAEAVGSALQNQGYAYELAPNGTAALQAITHQSFDVVVSDVRMDGMTGLELLDLVARNHPTLPVIIVTAFGSVPEAVDATKRGASDYLSKPYGVGELRQAIDQALDSARRRQGALLPWEDRPRRLAVRRDPVPPPVLAPPRPLLGSHPVMMDLRRRIECVAASAAPVLITGESGSGKDLVARAVHGAGPRRDRSFVSINASALPEALLESELFGHVRGAFTGASEARTGLFSTAHGGTLFLDEIGDMPRGLQAKLLRVLELGEVRPIGADHVRTVDVRVIAATHRDLERQVASGEFREDLFFRLNVLPLAVPPLGDRRSDIPELAHHFLAKARARMPNSPVRVISPEALDQLSRASWPGNVRELASAVERTVVFGRKETVEREDLAHVPTGESAAAGTPPPRELCTLRSLSERHVAWVLEQTAGNKPRAAKILGINLSTLYRWNRPSRAN